MSSNRSAPFTITLLTEGLGPQGAKGRDREPIRDFATFAYQHTLEILEIRNYRNLYFVQKAKENAWSLWGNSIERDQVERIN